MLGRESVTDNQEGYSKLDRDKVGLSQDLTGGNNSDDYVPPHKVGKLTTGEHGNRWVLIAKFEWRIPSSSKRGL
jgi:hypothetical protein